MKPLIPLFLALSSFTVAAAPPAATGSEFAQPHRLVDVGGHRLNLHCSGTGSPTVVFEAPAGSAGWTWWAVQPRVAAKTRACVHDRAGLGFSDPAPGAADARSAADDLHRLLAAAGIAPPYLLVGESMGGAVAQLFAWAHPAEVAAMVLAEPMHEDELIRADLMSRGKVSELEAQVAQAQADCAALAEKSPAAASPDWAQCLGGVDPSLPPAVGQVDLAHRRAPLFWRTIGAERASFPADRDQLRAGRAPFGELPLVVLVRGVSPWRVPGKPQSDANKAVEAANFALLTAIARSSSDGEVRVVPGAGHLVDEDAPGAVVQAVDDLLHKLGH